MRKLIFILSVIFSLSILGACGHSETDYKAVYEKTQNNEDLTEADYDMMLDYIDDVISAVGKVKNRKQLEELEDKYPYAEDFMKELMYGIEDEDIQSKLADKVKKVSDNFEKAQKKLYDKLDSLDDENDD